MLLPRASTGGEDGTFTFYASSTSGGTVDTLITIVVRRGLVVSLTVTPPAGTPGEWQFNDAVNSGQVLTIGF